MEEHLLKIFEGNSDLFITTSSTGEVDERGKVQVKTITIHEPVTSKLWKDHLEGKFVIGLRPERDEKIKWGCIDVDPQNYKDYSSKKYIQIIIFFHLKLKWV